MATARIWEAIDPAVIYARIPPDVFPMTNEQLVRFCEANQQLQVERTAAGEVILMPPVSLESGYRESEVIVQLRSWAKRNRTGVALTSSNGFFLPNGAMRSPDAAWLKKSRLKGITRQQKRSFPRLCPDFVVEVRSPNERLPALKAKMKEYIENGAQLGWLIDPYTEHVHIYSKVAPVRVLKRPRKLAGGCLLPGFVLDLKEIWDPDL